MKGTAVTRGGPQGRSESFFDCLPRVAFLLVILVDIVAASEICAERRCLAQDLMNKGYKTQPQSQNCTQIINVPFIEYQTLSVSTKNLRLISRLQATMTWVDPDLAWNESVYRFDKVVLPVNKVWTPELHVTNAVSTTMKHSSIDLLVRSNGSIQHTVIINAELSCDINLFRYPFARDECPVAIQAWAREGCGMELNMGHVRMISGDRGDWRTTNVTLLRKGTNDRNYLLVSLNLRSFNPFLSLFLPSILILVADLVSFALPLGGGERISFKITLVLSFIMFLIILNDLLPGDSQCSPLIRYHFCTCLIFLVISLLLAMMLTRVAKDGSLLPCSVSKSRSSEHSEDEEKAEEDEESKVDMDVIQLKSQEESKTLQKVAHFLEAMAAQDRETWKHQNLAKKIDKICFWTYLSLGCLYTVILTYLFAHQTCDIDHFAFWYDD